MDLDALSGNASVDPFGTGIGALEQEDADHAAEKEAVDAAEKAGVIHIRVQQRNGRKCITTVQGLDKKLDLKKILKVLQKKQNCNGTVVDNAEHGQVIQLQGDQRDAVKTFLVDNEIVDAKKVKKHGTG